MALSERAVGLPDKAAEGTTRAKTWVADIQTLASVPDPPRRRQEDCTADPTPAPTSDKDKQPVVGVLVGGPAGPDG